MLQDRESEVEFVGKSAFPQYLVYSELKNFYPHYALWIVTTHLYERLNTYAAAKYATRVREIVKSEDDVTWQKYTKWARVANNLKVWHPGYMPWKYCATECTRAAQITPR